MQIWTDGYPGTRAPVGMVWKYLTVFVYSHVYDHVHVYEAAITLLPTHVIQDEKRHSA